MPSLIYQNLGSSWAVGILGATKLEVEQRYYSLYNWGATNGELHWVEETEPRCFAYIWTTKKKLFQYFIKLEALKWDVDRVMTGPLKRKITRAAIQRFRELKNDKFIDFSNNIDYYSTVDDCLIQE
jgi:hypothetical protein